jgi:3'(2'), 5'-bisphosphate nucleotidase
MLFPAHTWYIIDKTIMIVTNMKTKHILDLIREAGNIAMKHYKNDIDINIKSDNSPVTNADLEVNSYILEGLAKLTPDIPVIAEESSDQENYKHISAKRFWCVDPIDGTKGYINHTDEFTVNIGLVEDNRAVQGFIYLPVADKLYYNEGQKAYKSTARGERVAIKCRKIPEEGASLLMSTRYPKEVLELFKDTKINELVSVGSAIKFCTIAEGFADIYPRIGPTCEWDTAAGQAIVEAAGGVVRTVEGKELVYGKKAFINPDFIVKGGVAR